MAIILLFKGSTFSRLFIHEQNIFDLGQTKKGLRFKGNEYAIWCNENFRYLWVQKVFLIENLLSRLYVKWSQSLFQSPNNWTWPIFVSKLRSFKNKGVSKTFCQNLLIRQFYHEYSCSPIIVRKNYDYVDLFPRIWIIWFVWRNSK